MILRHTIFHYILTISENSSRLYNLVQDFLEVAGPSEKVSELLKSSLNQNFLVRSSPNFIPPVRSGPKNIPNLYLCMAEQLSENPHAQYERNNGNIYCIYIIDVKCFVLKVNKEGGKSAKR